MIISLICDGGIRTVYYRFCTIDDRKNGDRRFLRCSMYAGLMRVTEGARSGHRHNHFPKILDSHSRSEKQISAAKKGCKVLVVSTILGKLFQSKHRKGCYFEAARTKYGQIGVGVIPGQSTPAQAPAMQWGRSTKVTQTSSLL